VAWVKAQLAIEYARLHKTNYTSFFWLDGKAEESLIQSILLVAARLPGYKMPAAGETTGLEESRKRAHEVLKWFSLERNSRWLLIYDNIDKTSYEEDPPEHSDMSNYNITSYFPHGDTGAIIITTRLKRLESLGSAVHLRQLDILDGLLILEKHAGTGQNLKQTLVVHPTETSDIDTWDPG